MRVSNARSHARKQRILHERRQPNDTKTIVVKNAGSIVFVPHADIDWIEAADYYSRLHTASGRYLVRRTMSALEREVDAEIFCRIHRSTIVRLERIRRLEANESGEYDVILVDGDAIGPQAGVIASGFSRS